MVKTFSFIKTSLLLGALLSFFSGVTQELYVFTEPASNMPSRSISGKISARILKNTGSEKYQQRYTPEVMFGVNKKLMVHLATTLSNMYSLKMQWESARLYAKYRFLSRDEVHKHFRLAAFAELSHSVNDPFFDELSLEGDQSGVLGGMIVTQLWNRLAVSSTVSFLQVTSAKPKLQPVTQPYQAFNYTISAGYLVLPFNYTDFKQTNFNIYAEVLGQQAFDREKYSIDFAPAVQVIFNSNAKINLGYRFQVSGNMNRMASNSWLISFERTFLDAWK